LFPQKFLSVQFLLLLDFAAYKKKQIKLFYLVPVQNISVTQKKRKKKVVQKDIYWFLLQKTKQEKLGSNQLRISSNLRIGLLGS
jgi:hypothetical protein